MRPREHAGEREGLCHCNIAADFVFASEYRSGGCDPHGDGAGDDGQENGDGMLSMEHKGFSSGGWWSRRRKDKHTPRKMRVGGSGRGSE